MESNKILICNRCDVALEERTAYFSYLDRTFQQKVLRCPKCGQVFIPEDLVDKKMIPLEKSLEEK